MPNLVCVHQPIPGISIARNTGLTAASGALFGFLDDDSLPKSDWAAQVVNFAETHPEVDAFGGPYDGYSDRGLPRWYPPAFGSWSQGEEAMLVSKVRGGNMAVRRSAFERVGAFREDLGIQGVQRGWGEETELFLRIGRAGGQVWYVPSMRIQHLILPQKFSLSAQLSEAWRYGEQESAIKGLDRSITRAAHSLLRAALERTESDSTTTLPQRAFLRSYRTASALGGLVAAISPRRERAADVSS
jgi:GT2 family glycosyltransferase